MDLKFLLWLMPVNLSNLIAKRDVAIVSDEAGTTRDVIETI